MDSAKSLEASAELDKIPGTLIHLLGEAVCDLDNDKLSGESFQSFHAALSGALALIKDKRLAARAGTLV